MILGCIHIYMEIQCWVAVHPDDLRWKGQLFVVQSIHLSLLGITELLLQATNSYSRMAFPSNCVCRNYSFNTGRSTSEHDRGPTFACSNSQWWHPPCSQLLQGCWWEWTSYCHTFYCLHLYWVCHNWEFGSYHANHNYVFSSLLYRCEFVLLPSGSFRCSQLAS